MSKASERSVPKTKHLSKYLSGAATLVVLATQACGPVSGQDRAGQISATGDEHARHGLAEISQPVGSARLAWGQPGGPAVRHPWPVQLLSIGHTAASYQNYGGSPYFHHGLDIRADAGSDVLASAGGKVVNIENYVAGDPAYWEVAILDDDGFLWQYHHVDRSSIPQAVHDALRSGEPIPAGTKIGEVYYWSVTTFGERFHHVHLNVLGAGDTYMNPFDFLDPLADTQAPEINAIGLLQNGRAVSGNRVRGAYSFYVTVADLIRHSQFVVPPQDVSFRIDGGQTTTVWDFVQLPGASSNTRYIHDYFVSSLTCGNYSCRKQTINLGFLRDSARSFPVVSGQHSLEVTARDYAGNTTTRSFNYEVY